MATPNAAADSGVLDSRVLERAGVRPDPLGAPGTRVTLQHSGGADPPRTVLARATTTPRRNADVSSTLSLAIQSRPPRAQNAHDGASDNCCQ